MKKISILGSTGSIGKSTLNVIRSSKNLYEVYALGAHSNIEELKKQIDEFNPKIVAVFDEKKAFQLKKEVNCKVVSSIEGLNEIVTHHEVDFVMMAISGSIALSPTIEAIKANKVIGLASKEVLVAAGDLVNDYLKKSKSKLIPVDSEHSAIFQCLKNESTNEIKRLILTASGGPFINLPEEKLSSITIKDALKHPNFNMGKKITIDSSTMMNKGLEIIEAYYLFNVDENNIDAIIHKEQIIHSMVEFQDGSILAQLSMPSMEFPIRYALSFPKRENAKLNKFDFVKNYSLTFFEVPNKFLCFKLAKEALKIKKSLPCFMNKANEVLVMRFLGGEINYTDISKKLEKLMSSHTPVNLVDLKTVLDIENEAFQKAKNL